MDRLTRAVRAFFPRLREQDRADDNLRERLAALEHDRWSRWQRYLHSCCDEVHGALRIPPRYVEHWERQMCTPYAELSEREKDSDREEADRTLEIVRTP